MPHECGGGGGGGGGGALATPGEVAGALAGGGGGGYFVIVTGSHGAGSPRKLRRGRVERHLVGVTTGWQLPP